MKKLICIVVTILLLTACATDKEAKVAKKVIVIKKDQTNVLTLGKEHKIFSNVLNEERAFTVCLPENYEESNLNYPVLYLLDGENHLRHAYGAADYLSFEMLIPELIVVAIHNIDRNRDFSPVHVDNIPTSGGADKFLGFLEDELIPHINKNYRASFYNVIMGHSFGGVFITHAMLEKPELFDGYVSVSPFLQYADNHMVKKSKDKLLISFDREVSYYLCIGDEPAYYDAINGFAEVIKERDDPNFHFQHKAFTNEDHGSMPYVGLNEGLRFVFSDWKLDDDFVNWELEELDQNYRDVAKKFGLNEMYASEDNINRMGYARLQSGDVGKAIEIFKENVKRYPDSANVYDSLGEAYEADRQLELAAKNFKKAWDMAVEQNHPFVDIFKANYERVTGNP